MQSNALQKEKGGTHDDPCINERFHLKPLDRMKMVSSGAAIIGCFSGFLDGVNRTSLVYLSENAHRLPKKVGEWYFYHKKKNYVMMIGGIKQGVRQGIKFSLIGSLFFGSEAFTDIYIRNGRQDFLNTTAASIFSSVVYGFYNRLSGIQIRNFMKRGFLVGLGVGIMEDALIILRGGSLWYEREIRNYLNR